ncbi:MAG: ABC transporter ATP-binding protein [Acidobacteriota bacterium]|jgi:putative ABC transport system ATP-binding protein|nr:ABC transporter ATP-binding protein [Acidobacteriota bacterium]
MHTIELAQIEKTYIMGDVRVPALKGVDLEVHSGEFIAIMGASGSGKSTLMNILGCLDYPTGGTYTLDGTRVDRMNRRQLADIRNRRIGFVFQGFNLLARTSALENVELPLMYFRGEEKLPARDLARNALERVGLGDRLDHEPTQLSGGQQQRVAIARALVNRPALVLADEPTGNLDTATSNDVMALFQELNNEGVTIVLVTHEPDIARFAKRIIELRDGLKIRDEPVVDRIHAGNGTSAFSGAQEVQS